jgi:hypothetical protein
MSASNKDSSGETGMVMHLLAKCLYQKGSVFYRGDLDILLKAFNFTKTCVSKNWILSRGDLVDPEMALVDPERAYEYFRRTFSEKEIRLLEFEVNSRKRAEDPERERLLLDAGYIAGDKMRFTGKGL